MLEAPHRPDRVVARFSYLLLVLLLIQIAAAGTAQSMLLPGLNLEREGWSVVQLSVIDGEAGGPFGRIVQDLANPAGEYVNRWLAGDLGRSCSLYEGFTWHMPLPDSVEAYKSALARLRIHSALFDATLMSYRGIELAGALTGFDNLGFRTGDGRLFGTLQETVGAFSGNPTSLHVRLVLCYAE